MQAYDQQESLVAGHVSASSSSNRETLRPSSSAAAAAGSSGDAASSSHAVCSDVTPISHWQLTVYCLKFAAEPNTTTTAVDLRAASGTRPIVDPDLILFQNPWVAA